jgi:hypothetical protein
MTPSLRTKRHLERATGLRLRGLRVGINWRFARPLAHATACSAWEPESTGRGDSWPYVPSRCDDRWRLISVTIERRVALPPHGVLVVQGCSEDVEPNCRNLRRATEAALVALDAAERAGEGWVEVAALRCRCVNHRVGSPLLWEQIGGQAHSEEALQRAGAGLDFRRCPLHKAGGLLATYGVAHATVQTWNNDAPPDVTMADIVRAMDEMRERFGTERHESSPIIVPPWLDLRLDDDGNMMVTDGRDTLRERIVRLLEAPQPARPGHETD